MFVMIYNIQIKLNLEKANPLFVLSQERKLFNASILF